MSREAAMNETGVIASAEGRGDQDEAANRAIRGVASTPSPEHVIPAEVVSFLYEHVDLMRAEFFGGQLPEVVLSFDVTDRRTLGHYTIRRNSLGVRWLCGSPRSVARLQNPAKRRGSSMRGRAHFRATRATRGALGHHARRAFAGGPRCSAAARMRVGRPPSSAW